MKGIKHNVDLPVQHVNEDVKKKTQKLQGQFLCTLGVQYNKKKSKSWFVDLFEKMQMKGENLIQSFIFFSFPSRKQKKTATKNLSTTSRVIGGGGHGAIPFCDLFYFEKQLCEYLLTPRIVPQISVWVPRHQGHRGRVKQKRCKKICVWMNILKKGENVVHHEDHIVIPGRKIERCNIGCLRPSRSRRWPDKPSLDVQFPPRHVFGVRALQRCFQSSAAKYAVLLVGGCQWDPSCHQSGGNCKKTVTKKCRKLWNCRTLWKYWCPECTHFCWRDLELTCLRPSNIKRKAQWLSLEGGKLANHRASQLLFT